MNNFDYKNMTPFKWFVLENFPFIENDFEAINNYHLFSKVVEYLNKTIDNMNLTGEQMENVTNAMTELQNYVNNYFNNLDVQEEINNKLDEMVEDGTFENILKPLLSEYEQAVNEINENVKLLQERMNTFTQLPAGSSGATDAEVNDARIGYNGTVYSNLGEAIRTQILNTLKSTALNINANNVETICNNNLNNLQNNLIYGCGIVDTTNLLNSPTTTLLGQIITFGKSATRSNGDTQIYTDFDTNSIYSRLYWSNTWQPWNKILNNNNTNNIILQGSLANITANNVETICNNDLNNLQNNLIYGCGIVDTTNLLNAPTSTLLGQIITFGKSPTRSNSDTQLYIDYDTNSIYSRLYWAGAWQPWNKITSSKLLNNYKYSVLGDSRSTFKGISPWSNYCHYPDSHLKNSKDMWWSVLERNTGLQRLKIDAYSGSTVSTGRPLEGYNGYEFCSDTRINALVDGNTKPDFIFVYGGINDFYGGVSIGDFDITSNNTDTFKNAIAITIQKIQTLCPNAKIYWICENISYYGNFQNYRCPINYVNELLGNYIQAEKDVCEKMGVPIIDLSVMNINKQNITNYLPDKLHGNILFNRLLGDIVSKEILK